MSSKANNNKVILLTGGSNGLGRTAAKRLLDKGYTLVITGRTPERLEKAVEWMDPKKQARTRIHTIILDLESLESIRNTVSSFKALELPLDILINNAGRTVVELEYTKETTKVEKTIFSNAIGPWYLSMQLAPLMKPHSRILFVTSRVHDPRTLPRFAQTNKAAIDKPNLFDILDGTPEYDGFGYYQVSKLAMIWVTYVMAKQFPSLVISTFCPGFVPITGLNRDTSYITRWALRYIMPWFENVTTEEQSISEYCHYVTSEELNGASGKYVEYGQESQSSPRSYNMEEANKFWNLACELCNTLETNLNRVSSIYASFIHWLPRISIKPVYLVS